MVIVGVRQVKEEKEKKEKDDDDEKVLDIEYARSLEEKVCKRGRSVGARYYGWVVRGKVRQRDTSFSTPETRPDTDHDTTRETTNTQHTHTAAG